MANVGIATGAVSGLVVLDVDGEEGMRSLRHLIEAHGLIDRTATVRTARGFHCYYDLPIEDHALKCSSGDGLDVRANGGYVVAPPSIHESGHIYSWVSA